MNWLKKIGPMVIGCTVGLVLTGLWAAPPPTNAQEEVASAMRRYKAYEQSTGYYEEYEVLPRRQRDFISYRGVGRDRFAQSPTAAVVRSRSRLADSHQGLKFYTRRRCEDCHPKEAENILSARANLTCRQCHGGEPIASIDHYYSPLNPIRRHAMVCAKCHPGVTASFAQYVVHEPDPSLLSTLRTFPALFYAFWIMVGLAIMTFLLFLPHTLLWGLRELFGKRGDHNEQD